MFKWFHPFLKSLMVIHDFAAEFSEFRGFFSEQNAGGAG
jgi:hypothetical protein